MIKFYLPIAAVIIISAAVYGSIQYGRSLERAENNAIIVELQSNIMALGRVIQKQEDETANETRKLVVSEGERVNAIKTNDHNTAEIKRLERFIRREREKFKAENANKASDDVYYRVIDISSSVRVWDEARSSSELPASVAPSILQGGLSSITADGINKSIKACIGQYNACAIKYNQLWPACDRLIESSQKKATD